MPWVPLWVVLDDALGKHGLVDDELADQVDQAIDAVEIDADRRVGAPAASPLCLAAGGSFFSGASGFLRRPGVTQPVPGPARPPSRRRRRADGRRSDTAGSSSSIDRSKGTGCIGSSSKACASASSSSAA